MGRTRGTSKTRLQPSAQLLLIQAPADQHQFVFLGPDPRALIERKSRADQVEYELLVRLADPENAFAAEYLPWQLPVEKILKPVDGKGTRACEKP